MDKEIAVLIPALNEEKTIVKVIKDFKRELPKAKIYVFDNGSIDHTKELAEKAGAIVDIVRMKGKGAVVREMFHSVNADYYIMADGDDTYPANEVHKLLKPVMDDMADMTIGSRMKKFQKEEKKLLHNMGNRIIRANVNFLFNTNINDMLSGYRVFSKNFVKSINLLSSGFEIETELTIKALENHYRIKEIPINYGTRPEGSKSKLKSFTDGSHILQTTIQLFRDYRPMQFFLMLALVSFAVSAGFSVDVLTEYFTVHHISHYYSFTLTLLFFFIGFQFIVIGIIASSVHSLRQELLNVIRINYRVRRERAGQNRK